MTDSMLSNILICGRGLAFEMALAALARNLPVNVQVTGLELTNLPDHDAFYGSVTSPTAYDFFRELGLDEPEIITQTNTTFCYGSHYQNWAGSLDWVQSHHLSFPVWNNIQFHHYLRKQNKRLEPYLVNAVAGRAGVFAHPPQDKDIPLSRAEYGYQFCPHSFARFLKDKSTSQNVQRVCGELSAVNIKDDKIVGVQLKDGRELTAQLFIDATGTAGLLTSSMATEFHTTRSLGVIENSVASSAEIHGLRIVENQSFGWQSKTHLQNSNSVLSIYHPGDAQQAKSEQFGERLSEFDIELGHQSFPWRGNCVAIGHASCVIEPLTPAPITLLQLDIQRLMGLIPIVLDMSVEEKEFNRLARLDIEHSQIFNDAFFKTAYAPDTHYWQDAKAQNSSEKLGRKIRQFESRGFLSAFDFEPFNEQDWTILHFGMGREIERVDPFIDNIPDATIRERLDALEMSVKQIVTKMPPHGRYLGKFISYLERKNAE